MKPVILTFMIIFGQFGVGLTACQGFMSMQETSTMVLIHEKSAGDHQMDHCAPRCDFTPHELFLSSSKNTHKTFFNTLEIGLRVDFLPVEVPFPHPFVLRTPTPGPDGFGAEVYLLNSSFLI